MIIAGAGGFAKEVFEILNQQNKTTDLAMYVDVALENATFLNGVPILSDPDSLESHFAKHGNSFVVGIGNPENRIKFTERMQSFGGEVVSLISLNAEIGGVDVHIGLGTVILGGVRISNSVSIQEGCIIYYNAIITHDCSIGKFVEISPGATVLGRAIIGDYCQLGANCTILPNVRLGKNVTVGAGAVVTKDQPDNSVVAGIPARIINQSRSF